uniref:Uncharacterized protein n=1 Tax=Brassica oleracea TaxID=3712 RepID=A0A3P6F8Q9_BRAOL|nr:unnamed protein product [Brassica oleracea]
MLLEMTTVRTIDRLLETGIYYHLAKKHTTREGTMILSQQANIAKKLGGQRESMYLHPIALREREHLKALVINNLLGLHLARRERQQLKTLPKHCWSSVNWLNRPTFPQIMLGNVLLDCPSRKNLQEN